MAKIIQKLNRLIVSESFIQINTIKGFKYVDKAGEVTNRYITEDRTELQYSMTPLGMVIVNPTPKIEALQVTPTNIWAKFTIIDSLDQIATLFTQEAKAILQMLDVERLSRIGWRTYFSYEFDDDEHFTKYFSALNPIAKSQLASITTQIDTGRGFNANLTINPLMRADDTKIKASLFDIDIFKGPPITSDQIQRTLKEFLSYMQDHDGFLALVNGTFE